MRILLLASLIPASLALAGCGPSPPQQRTQSAEAEYAKDTRSEILRIHALAKKSLPEAKREIDVLVENFEGYEDEPLGDQKATYDGIVSGLKELQGMMSGGGARQQIAAKLEEIAGLARQLSVDEP